MELNGSAVLVTGANGGLGTEFVLQALERGATKVYATARRPHDWDDPRIVPLTLDVNDRSSIDAALDEASDVDVVINNSGLASSASLLTGDEAELRSVMETNFWGALAVARAFAPQLVNSEHGVLLNVLSSASWHGRQNAYSASKAALWAATNAMRLELDGRGVQVVALHLGYARTRMTEGVDAEMMDPGEVVRVAYDGIVGGSTEILADEYSRRAKARVAGSIEDAYPELGHAVAG
jgi:NAD(P)-dependent dehydrogenase (short-subunit alcohol dehydrogenase family)